MSSDTGASNEFATFDSPMGFGSDAKKSSSLTSKTMKEQLQFPQPSQDIKYQCKLKEKDGVTTPYRTLPHKIRQDRDGKIFVQRKLVATVQGECVKGNKQKADELIKYMSSLPDYLQRPDKEENPQEKALNVGVLDWGRLEKWKYNRKPSPVRGNHPASSVMNIISHKTISKSSASSSSSSTDNVAKSWLNPSACSSYTHHSDGLPRDTKLPVPKVLRFQHKEIASKSSTHLPKNVSGNYKSAEQCGLGVNSEKNEQKDLVKEISLEMGSMLSNMRKQGVSLRPHGVLTVLDVEAQNTGQVAGGTDRRKRAPGLGIYSEIEASSSRSGDPGVSSSLRQVLSSEINERKKVDSQDSISLDYQGLPGQPTNIVLLRPKRSFQIRSIEGPPELGEKFTEVGRKSSLFEFSKMVLDGERSHDVPDSCPLRSHGVQTDSEMEKTQEESVEQSCDGSSASSCSNEKGSMLSELKHGENNVSLQTGDTTDALKLLEQDMAEAASRKSRNSSPNRRFGFSFSRMGQSFSFKEGSSVPQLRSDHVSSNSGPITPEDSTVSSDTNRGKINGHNRSRSSPLRRILDPLLKSRGVNSNTFAVSDQPVNGSSNSGNLRTTDAREPIVRGKCEATVTQALLHLTVKNGLPLFRFVVDNKSNILVATLNHTTSAEKADLGQNYNFYSVNEVKRKGGGWLGQGGKEKSCGYVHNIIGQMKVSSLRQPDFTGQTHEKQCAVKEYVLYGLEKIQSDQAPPRYKPNSEVAAAVVQMQTEKLSYNIHNSSTEFLLAKDDHGYEGIGSTSVILPSAIHSLPENAAPSPLIDRWRSGGLCDCGGWDVGCKLRVLTDDKKSSNILETCISSNRIQLFVEGVGENSRAIFSLVPHKNGIYAIEFHSSISDVQAFFISVMIVSCWMPSTLSSTAMSEEKSEVNGSGSKVSAAVGKMSARIESVGGGSLLSR